MKQTIGKVEGADGGTLFLDEIGDMPLALQAKLLRFLQQRVIERVGGRELIPVDVRIVAATNRDLEAAMKEGSFRQDLYYRICEITVPIPPLRERDSDSVLIANYLLNQACQRHNRQTLKFATDALQAIEAYRWPGNVRELENRVNRAAIMAEGKLVTVADLGLSNSAVDSGEQLTLREIRARADGQAVQRALAVSEGNVSQAAKLLGVTRPTLYDLMEQLGIRRAAD